MDAMTWGQHKDSNELLDGMKMFQGLIENINPTQEEVHETINSGWYRGMDEYVDLFTTLPYPQAIQKLFDFPQERLDRTCWVLSQLFLVFNKTQYDTQCRNGCEHEGHNLHKLIRTEDLLGLVGFYTSIGLTFVHKASHSGEHYRGYVGQSELKIYHLTKSTKKEAGLNHHLRFRLPNFDQVIDSLNKRKIPVAISSSEDGVVRRAVLSDLDGRTVTVYDGL